MNHRSKAAAILLLVALFVLAPAPARADDDELNLASFQVGGLYLFSAGSIMTVGASWTPLVNTGAVSFRGQFGFFIPKNLFGDYFLAFDYEALARLELFPDVRLEGGGGFQTFTAENGGTSPVLSLGLSLGFGGGFFDRLYATYSHLFRSSVPLDEISFGLGICF